MPEFPKPVPGRFCWAELSTRDPEAAFKFYSGLFDWTSQTMPMSHGEKYFVAQRGGKHIAGMRRTAEEAKKNGAPPYWLPYIAVDDTDKTAQDAESLGAQTIVPPMSFETARMAVLKDPAGGVFALWQTANPMGTWLYNEPGSVCWFELDSTDTKATRQFYTKLCGWTTSDDKMPNGDIYTIFKQGEGGPESMVGGMMEMPKEAHGARTMWLVYFATDNPDDTVARATKAGAKVLLPLRDAKDVGRFGVLQDPQGAVFAVMKWAR